jgi:hypothetical protein
MRRRPIYSGSSRPARLLPGTQLRLQEEVYMIEGVDRLGDDPHLVRCTSEPQNATVPRYGQVTGVI